MHITRTFDVVGGGGMQVWLKILMYIQNEMIDS